MKITPAHDFNDFEVGRRCNLNSINILDKTACIELNEDDFPKWKAATAGKGLSGLKRVNALVKRLCTRLVAEIEDNTHMVPFGDRSDVVIEPWLTDQWYVDAAHLPKPAIAAVKSGANKFVPQNWEKTYFDWMENIQPWCISRQLWWGHQIQHGMGRMVKFLSLKVKRKRKLRPMLITARHTELTAMRMFSILGFSSALWPFSTLGGQKRPIYWHGITKPMCLSPVLTLFSSACPDDDDGTSFHGIRLSHSLYSCAGPR